MIIKILKGKDVKVAFPCIELIKTGTIFSNSLSLNEYTSAINEDSQDIIMGLYNQRNQLLGMILYKFTGSEVDLREIVVLNTLQGKGLGSLLLKEFINDIFERYRNMKNLSFKYITLQVASNNERMKNFYARNGFKTITYRFPHPNYIKHDLMELDLEPQR